MKKFCIFLLMVSFILTGTTACTHKKKPNMVQSQRRFAKYVEPQSGNTNATGTIDLSEGPRQNYDRNLGPQNINFDIKIVDPY